MPRTAKLNDIQLILLSTACQRPDGSLLPPPESLGEQSDRIRKAVTALIKRSLAQEVDVEDVTRSWRSDDTRKIGVAITDAGRAVIGTYEEAPLPPAPAPDNNPVVAVLPVSTVAPSPETAPEFSPRAGSKQALVVELLRRDAGASITELAEATGWLPHTTRAALTGMRKRNLGIATEKVQGVTRYRVAQSAAK